MHPYMDKLMREAGCQDLTNMSKRTGIGLKVLRDLAYHDKFEGYAVRYILQLSKACGVSVERLAEGFRSKNAHAA